ncbi:MAG: 6-carboxytetrahydropterin synthase [Phycisphaerales bacterium]|jgi:6-pyruvoyltetrahydropterin/6-carboxytetrahydropterin synthase|nr:6-carboxytetrahydropterin synthase [Phycisphaerales bacterium]
MSTYEVSVSVNFSAAHALPLGEGKFEDPHQHTWRAEAAFRSDNIDNEMGVVIDFLEVQDAMDAIAAQLNDQDLNLLDAFNDATTSAENVAAWIACQLWMKLAGQGTLYRVSVTEAPGCTASYYP